MPATDALSLADAKRQLRLIGPENDVLVLEAIEAAVGFVGAAAGDIPLVEVASTYQADPRTESPACIGLSYITAVRSVSYWSDGDAYRDEPPRTLDVATLGRLVRFRGRSWVYPPVDGWPARRGPLVFEVARKHDITDADDPLRQAVIIACREFFNGHREIPRTHAVYRLIAAATADPDAPMPERIASASETVQPAIMRFAFSHELPFTDDDFRWLGTVNGVDIDSTWGQPAAFGIWVPGGVLDQVERFHRVYPISDSRLGHNPTLADFGDPEPYTYGATVGLLMHTPLTFDADFQQPAVWRVILRES